MPENHPCPECKATLTWSKPAATKERPDPPGYWTCTGCEWVGSEGARLYAGRILRPGPPPAVQQRKPGLPSALQPTGHLTCPGCWCNTIRETVPPRDGHTGLYACTQCNWQGAGKELKPVKEDVAEARQAEQCFNEQRRKGKKGKGGGSKSGRSAKKGAKTCRYRPKADEWVGKRLANPKNNVVKAPRCELPADEMNEALGRFFEKRRQEASGE